MEHELMKNIPILKHILGTLSLDEMKAIRTVNKSWNLILTTFIIRKSKIVLDKSLDPQNSKSPEGFKNVLKVFSPTIFISRLNLSGFSFDTDLNSITEILSKIGRAIKFIELENTTVDKNFEFWNLVILNSKYTPGLRELKIKYCYFIEHPTNIWIPEQSNWIRKLVVNAQNDRLFPCFKFAGLTRCFPQLEAVTATGLHEDEYLELISALRSCKGKLISLECFRATGTLLLESVSSICLMRLAEIELNLENFGMDLGSVVNIESLKQLLGSFAPTLIKLTLIRSHDHDALDVGFPFGVDFPALNFLYIGGNCVKSIAFIVAVPKLDTLWIRCNNTNRTNFDTQLFSVLHSYDEIQTLSNTRHESLVEIRVEFELTQDNERFIRGIFPKLESFGFYRQGNWVMQNL